MSFTVMPLPADIAAELRCDASIVRVADEYPGYPCRACLRDVALGDEVVLVSYDPFDGWTAAEHSPYRTPSPVFIHARDCSAEVDTTDVPDQLVRRRLSVRAFDTAALMVDGRVVDGTDLHATLVELAARPDVDRIHVHNAGPGCFAAAVAVAR